MRVIPTKDIYHLQEVNEKKEELTEIKEKPIDHDTKLIRAIKWFYTHWAYFVAKYSVLIIVLCTIITLVGTAKVITTPNENDITGYTPYGARARDEFNVAGEFFSRGGNGIALFALLVPKDGRDVMNDDVLREAVRVEEILSTNFTMYNPVSNKSENFREFCYSFCQINTPFVMFVDGFFLQRNLSARGLTMNDRMNLSFPIGSMYDRKINVQPNFFGVELYDDILEEQSNITALSTDRRITNIKGAKMLALQLRAERKDGWTTQDVKDYEMAITTYFEKTYSSPYIRVLTLSTSFVEAEVVRAGMSLLPFLIVGFSIMAIISTITTFLSALYMQQVSIHKFSLAIMACICPFMACGTALGGLFFMGVRFGSILCVTPFLVLAIGVDDAYLMLHAWQRVTRRRRSFPEDGDCAASRLAEVLSDTGPAIMISALTNILADLVGTYTSSPEITLLSYGNMACITVDFIYQISFYSAVMCIAGSFEIDAERANRHTHSMWCGDENGSMSTDETKSVDSFHDRVKSAFSNFLENYVSLVCNKFFDMFIIIVWFAYLAINIYGITVMPINLTPKKLFSQDSSLLEMDDLRVEYVIPYFTLATLFVNNPGNLSDPTRLKRLNTFVDEFENIDGAWGSATSNYFIRDFIEYEKTMRELENGEDGTEITGNENDIPRLNFNDVASFIEWPEYEFWRGFIRMRKDNTTGDDVLDKFFLTTAFKGQQLKQWIKRDDMLKKWRSVVDNYSAEFNITVYYDDGIYLDLIDNMPTDTWQSAVATLGCMALLCFIFMYNFFTVCVATAVIASIMTGILGTLSLTGTELDPIVMAALIISIGFSVDIPAHVSYHYHVAGHHMEPPVTVTRRLKYCLSSVGFPALQASLSTSLCVLSLLFVSIYMSQVFVKTMILCMSLCVLHGLLLIPCICSVFDPLLNRIHAKP